MEQLINLIKRKSTYKLIIPSDVERKIRYLCTKIPNVEWSGTLFYTYEGSMDDGSLVITCKDIFVMDIGSAAYTEFDMSPDVISYMCDNPELLGVQMGLIHSHNNMSCFFSGTDTATLREEGRDRNHFVSLIVNNEGTYTAAITRKIKSIKSIHESYSYGSFEDTTITGTKEYQEESEYIEYYGLDITKEGENFSFQELDNRITEIRKKKASSPKPTKIIIGGGSESQYNREPVCHQPISEPSDYNFIKKRPFIIDMDEDPRLPLSSKFEVSEKDIQDVLIQLITGSIILRDTSKIDINKWVTSMPQVFGNRFGNSKEGIKKFESWADGHCEFLICDKEPDDITAEEETDWIANFAEDLYDKLSTLPNNEYIEILKDIVKQWII